MTQKRIGKFSLISILHIRSSNNFYGMNGNLKLGREIVSRDTTKKKEKNLSNFETTCYFQSININNSQKYHAVLLPVAFISSLTRETFLSLERIHFHNENAKKFSLSLRLSIENSTREKQEESLAILFCGYNNKFVIHNWGVQDKN